MVNVKQHTRFKKEFFLVYWNGMKLKAFSNKRDAELYCKNILLDNLDVLEIKKVKVL
jgi:hypothetical protein